MSSTSTASAPPQPVRPSILLVGVGGAVGTALRFVLGSIFATPGGFPLAIVVINVVGAFGLGLLLEGLARRGADDGGRRSIRLLVGTGFFGGFTTYSTFALDTVQLTGAGAVAAAIGSTLVTLVLGTAAAWLGIVVAARASGRSRGFLG